MPAMIACGRRWPIGSDDLVFPGIFSLIVRVFVIMCLVFALIAYRDSLSCEDIKEVVSMVYAMLILAIVITICEVLVVIFSARGTIINSKPRWPVVYLLYIRIVLFSAETILAILGTVFSFIDKVSSTNADPACADLSQPTTALRVLMVLVCLVLLGIIVGALLYVDPCRLYRSRDHYNPHFTDELIFMPHRDTMTDASQELWQNRQRASHAVWERGFKTLFCGCNSKMEHRRAYTEVAAIFSRIFCDVNVVPSDIAAVLILLQRHQLAEEENRRRSWEDMDEDVIRRLLPKFSDATEYFSKPVDFTNREEAETFQAAKYYMKYAMAAYTWLGYLYYGEAYGSCKLCSRVIREGCCFQRKRDHIYMDNRCYCNLYGFSLASGLLEGDIFYCSFENEICRVPFYIAFDHEKKTIVVAVRGTFSLSDVVTDLISYTEPILMPGTTGGKAHYAHKGIYKSAKWVKERLYADGLLDRAFALEPGYNLITTGHSLGGGCAALLGLLLKEDYPDIKCYTYGTPGSLLDINGALYTQSFITTVTLGKDLIARLSVYTGYMLKHDLLKLASVYEKPKFRILLEGMLETLMRCLGRNYSFPVIKIDSHVFPDDSSAGPNPHSELQSNVKTNLQSYPNPPAATPEALGGSLAHTVPLNGQGNSLCYSQASTLNEQDEDPADIELCVPTITESEEDEGYSVHSLLIPNSEDRGDSDSDSNPGNQSPSIFQYRLPLFPPGKVIHLREIRAQRQCFLSKRRFEAHWVNNESFQRIIINPNMLRDHFPGAIANAMDYVWNELGDVPEVVHHST